MAKQKFKITNWPTYNKALRQRGSLTVWLDESAIAAWTDSSSPEGRGRPLYYTDMAVIAKRHYFDNSQLCFFAAYQGIGCNHF